MEMDDTQILGTNEKPTFKKLDKKTKSKKKQPK